MRGRLWLGWVSLMLLTAAGLYSAYWPAFALWMMAYPFADPRYWRPRLYLLLVQTGFVLVCWVGNVVWLRRQRRDSHSLRG
jgi:hypothetical protein